ncbi:hypothetical protein AB3Y40_14290 [Yoonia sp. R2331]|uniref:hypothetical protein n=1 Tax=Yoonia sp. R2331 TaxID=3237238 RepID=UPI0034E5503B
MTFQTLDGPVLYMLMAVGLIFALAGLRLIFKNKEDENAARIELFGLKFQSSSAGTLVLLIGAAFLSTPLFAPRADAIAPPAPGTPANPPAAAAPADPPSGGATAIVLPASADAEEVENNDAITAANQFALGYGAKGSLDRNRDDFSDWYVIDTSGTGNTDFAVQARSSGSCRVYIYDQNEVEIDMFYCGNNGGSAVHKVFSKGNSKIFLQILFNNGSGSVKTDYEVFVRRVAD